MCQWKVKLLYSLSWQWGNEGKLIEPQNEVNRKGKRESLDTHLTLLPFPRLQTKKLLLCLLTSAADSVIILNLFLKKKDKTG